MLKAIKYFINSNMQNYNYTYFKAGFWWFTAKIVEANFSHMYTGCSRKKWTPKVFLCFLNNRL